MTVNPASSNFTQQVKQARNLSQILIGNQFHVTLRIVSPCILFKVNPENTTKNPTKQQLILPIISLENFSWL